MSLAAAKEVSMIAAVNFDVAFLLLKIKLLIEMKYFFFLNYKYVFALL